MIPTPTGSGHAPPHHLVTALLETVTRYGLLGWLYVAAVAAVHPHYLPGALTHWLPLRRDTFGALCFAASAVGFLLLNVLGDRAGWLPFPAATDEPERRDGSEMFRHRLLPAVLRTVFGYGLLIWLYVCVNSLTHPETISRQLTHFLAWPLEGDTGSVCFVLSAVAFLLLRMRVTPNRRRCRA
jgi:hypothetical protein